MTISRDQKEQIVRELSEVFKTSRGAVFANYKGLTVAQFEDLRKKMREQGGKIKVAKLTLMRLALKQAGIDLPLDAEVPTAVAYSPDDEIAPAKIVAGFGDKDNKLELLGGLLSGKSLSGPEVAALSKLPGKQELRGQLVGVLAGPMRGMVGVLSGVQRSFLYALNAIGQSKS